MNNDSGYPGDVWSEWLLHGRHADDPRFDQAMRRSTERYADRVVDLARLAPGMALADVGTGDGLVAFRAIERIGATLRVQMIDVSEPLLRHAEQLAVERGIRDQCSFLRCSAERLEGIGAGTIDVVTTRAVLAYVADKAGALREFLRVLKPGGRISLAEPILQDDALMTRALKNLVETRRPESLPRFMPLLHRWKAAQYPDTEEKMRSSAIANYSERDLIRLAGVCGFDELHLELHIDVIPSIIPSWQAFLKSSPHPLAPPLDSILAEQFNAEERELFESVMRPEVESGGTMVTERIAYLSARKPPL